MAHRKHPTPPLSATPEEGVLIPRELKEATDTKGDARGINAGIEVAKVGPASLNPEDPLYAHQEGIRLARMEESVTEFSAFRFEEDDSGEGGSANLDPIKLAHREVLDEEQGQMHTKVYRNGMLTVSGTPLKYKPPSTTSAHPVSGQIFLHNGIPICFFYKEGSERDKLDVEWRGSQVARYFMGSGAAYSGYAINPEAVGDQRLLTPRAPLYDKDGRRIEPTLTAQHSHHIYSLGLPGWVEHSQTARDGTLKPLKRKLWRGWQKLKSESVEETVAPGLRRIIEMKPKYGHRSLHMAHENLMYTMGMLQFIEQEDGHARNFGKGILRGRYQTVAIDWDRALWHGAGINAHGKHRVLDSQFTFNQHVFENFLTRRHKVATRYFLGGQRFGARQNRIHTEDNEAIHRFASEEEGVYQRNLAHLHILMTPHDRKVKKAFEVSGTFEAEETTMAHRLAFRDVVPVEDEHIVITIDRSQGFGAVIDPGELDLVNDLVLDDPVEQTPSRAEIRRTQDQSQRRNLTASEYYKRKQDKYRNVLKSSSEFRDFVVQAQGQKRDEDAYLDTVEDLQDKMIDMLDEVREQIEAQMGAGFDSNEEFDSHLEKYHADIKSLQDAIDNFEESGESYCSLEVFWEHLLENADVKCYLERLSMRMTQDFWDDLNKQEQKVLGVISYKKNDVFADAADRSIGAVTERLLAKEKVKANLLTQLFEPIRAKIVEDNARQDAIYKMALNMADAEGGEAMDYVVDLEDSLEELHQDIQEVQESDQGITLDDCSALVVKLAKVGCEIDFLEHISRTFDNDDTLDQHRIEARALENKILLSTSYFPWLNFHGDEILNCQLDVVNFWNDEFEQQFKALLNEVEDNDAGIAFKHSLIKLKHDIMSHISRELEKGDSLEKVGEHVRDKFQVMMGALPLIVEGLRQPSVPSRRSSTGRRGSTVVDNSKEKELINALMTVITGYTPDQRNPNEPVLVLAVTGFVFSLKKLKLQDSAETYFDRLVGGRRSSFTPGSSVNALLDFLKTDQEDKDPVFNEILRFIRHTARGTPSPDAWRSGRFFQSRWSDQKYLDKASSFIGAAKYLTAPTAEANEYLNELPVKFTSLLDLLEVMDENRDQFDHGMGSSSFSI